MAKAEPMDIMRGGGANEFLLCAEAEQINFMRAEAERMNFYCARCLDF